MNCMDVDENDDDDVDDAMMKNCTVAQEHDVYCFFLRMILL